MRPRRPTAVASTTRSDAPELASMPRWLTCQSLAQPSSELYWHMGETTMRLSSSRSASRIGENKALVMGFREEVGWEDNREGVRNIGSALLVGQAIEIW